MSQQDFENGLKVRTEVMGEAFVKRAQDNTVPFTQPLQDWINYFKNDKQFNNIRNNDVFMA